MTNSIELVKKYIRGWIHRNPEEILDSFEEGGVYIDPLLDKELQGSQIADHARLYFDLFPNLSFEGVDSITETNGLYATQWIMRGSFKDTNGSGICIPGADFVQVGREKIRSVQAYFDHRKIPSKLLALFAEGGVSTKRSVTTRSLDIVGMTNIKYSKSPLSQEKLKQIGQDIIHLMEQEKLYQDSDLSLSRLAVRLGQSTNHVSQVINSYLNQNFNDLVNSYRIQDAKNKLLAKNNKQSILNIALDVGFASKSTFNAIFKKQTRQTPTQFIQANNKNRI